MGGAAATPRLRRCGAKPAEPNPQPTQTVDAGPHLRRPPCLSGGELGRGQIQRLSRPPFRACALLFFPVVAKLCCTASARVRGLRSRTLALGEAGQLARCRWPGLSSSLSGGGGRTGRRFPPSVPPLRVWPALAAATPWSFHSSGWDWAGESAGGSQVTGLSYQLEPSLLRRGGVPK